MSQVKYVPTETDIKGVLHVEDPENPREIYAEYTVPAPATELSENPSTRKLAYDYDDLGRLTGRRLYADDSGSGMSVLNTYYAYVSGGHGTDSETGLISWLGVGNRSLTYTYDDVGNIIREKTTWHNPSGSEMSFLDAGGARLPLYFNDPTASHLPLTAPIPGNRSYEYDKLGQLTRVNDEHAGETWTYAYDQGGNTMQKQQYEYNTGGLSSPLQTINYTYGDPNWKDKLTAYDGKAITYDAIGNPLTFDGWAYTWKAGRMLHSMSNGSTNAQFTYDHTGLRVKKTVNGVDTLYTYNGKNITHMRKENTQMHFFYDAQGRPSIVRQNGIDYAYMHNLQGDIIGIMDMGGKVVVEYAYDAWGKLLRTEGDLAGTLGSNNPFRYRGYVYDEETGLYYLRSRYYSPEWGRFLNADVLLGQEGAVLSHNAFTYCLNKPTMRVDASGMISIGIGTAGVGVYQAAMWIMTMIIALAQPAPIPQHRPLPTTLSVPDNILNFRPQATPEPIIDFVPRPRQEPATATPRPTPSVTLIYRGGGYTYFNLTPRPGRDTGGLSFYLSPPPGRHVVTTLEAVNATGVLEAVIDGANHVSVRPRNIIELSEWALTRPNANENPHPYTLLLYSITWRGN